MREYRDKYDFTELVLLALQGEVTAQQMERLDHILITDPEKIRAYVELMEMYTELSSSGSVEVSCEANDSTEKYETFLQLLANEEDTAPKIEIPQEIPQQKLIQKVIYPPQEKRKISKFAIFTLINAAAMILFVLFINLLPPNDGIEVVTLADSMNAKWADIAVPLEKGTRMATGSDWLLRAGLAELLFDTNARVVIEGPAEFQVQDEDRISLRYGKLYATVPQEAIGFTVNAPSARIIDLGTEFGVETDNYGNTCLYMTKGRTTLITGEKSNKLSMEVSKGDAKKISRNTQTVTDISLEEDHFIHAFDAERNVVWRQQPSLDLVDIAGRGNGLGTGEPSVIIHPVKGYTKDSNFPFIKPQGFLPIGDNPFIDGIFVPNGNPVQIISTQGDVFKEAPKTSGLFSIDLVANPDPRFFEVGIRKGTIEFDGQCYGNGGKSCISMHANIGLTFDLKAIRQYYQRSITRFTSRIGIFDTNEPYPCNADFWVLVDGEVRYSLRQYKQKDVLNDVTVAIKDTDRFLTLVTTDGGDPDNPQGSCYERSNSCDWCVFTEPVLILE